ncbi:MAG: DUF4388 domain-containing protein [Nitrospiraceae bacterium]|nr:DUF4388 domain-containing protein [Nitrospiraceae bacterium]
MALEGNLREFGLADILQLIYYQRKTGVLTVTSSMDKVKLLFYEGNIVFAESSRRGESRIGRLMIKKGMITQEQLDSALAQQKTSGGKLGNNLLKLGLISKDGIKDTLVNQFTETVSYLFTWRQGVYEFRPQGIPIDKDIPISLDTQHVLMDGLRILDEWSVMEGKITLDSLFIKTAMAGEAEELSPEEKDVLALVDGENDVSAISGLSGLDNFQVSKALLSLHEKGFVNKLKETEAAQPQAAKKRGKLPSVFFEALVAVLFLVSLVISMLGWPFQKSRAVEASQAIDGLRFRVEQYKIEHGAYPATLGQVGDTVDPWGRQYVYSAITNSYVLYSTGPGGQPGAPDNIY